MHLRNYTVVLLLRVPGGKVWHDGKTNKYSLRQNMCRLKLNRRLFTALLDL